ncbi:unnamed protein product, partial [Meganyctiphanes norvegica]
MKFVHITIALLGVALVHGASDGQKRQQRILAAYSTRTISSMTTTTITSFYTCASQFAAAPNACVAGRKMRRYKSLSDDELNESKVEGELASSMSEIEVTDG